MAKAPPTLDQITGDLRRRMEGALDTLKKEFAGLRTGRASPALLEPIKVEVYGTEMPITQVGTIGVPEPRMLTVQVWDRAAVSSVEKAIRDAGLGLNPASDGQTVRVPLPPLTAERRIELAKLAGKYAEAARVAIRAVRRDGMETLKKLEKDHEIGQDVHRDWAEEVQKLTDGYIRKVDEALAAKEADIKQP
ncbi:ribosome recycling factor [Elioraea tepidiphila]|jgi:ribosome recycling factor|uniref:ribosome recycling factor n=1 Tax=Elioraea tepidiphila TaxID=457934 RepID=UPI00036BD0FA|nr:ribosome recycling factor [Elioraea tepidiphila]